MQLHRDKNFIWKILKEQKQPPCPHPMHSWRFWKGRASVCSKGRRSMPATLISTPGLRALRGVEGVLCLC